MTRWLLLVGALSPAFGQAVSGAALRGDCQDRLADLTFARTRPTTAP